MSLTRSCLLLVVLALSASLMPGPAEAKDPPACSALSFRPLASGSPDGEREAGLYKSRFVKIELKATIKSGEAQNYYMVLNGQRSETAPGALPKGVESCLKSKHVTVPVKTQPTGNCTGDRFRVVIDSGAKQKMAMLFGLKGGEWHLCSAMPVPPKS